MKKVIIYLIVVIVLAVLTVLRLKTNKETTQKRVYQYDKENPINVRVDTLSFENISGENSYIGTFEPYKETKISAESQGKIIAVHVDLGSSVTAGQTLIQLDNSLLKLQLQSIEVQIEGLETDVKRYTILAEADAIQRIQLEKSQLALKSANIQKASLIDQINKTTIKSPFNGIITAKMTELGAFAAPGIPLLQITDIANLRFTVNLPEQEMILMNLGQKVKLNADVFPGLELDGEITMIGSKANIGNSYAIQFLVKNTPDLKIKSGMSGEAIIANHHNQQQILILASSIVGTNIKPQVYIIKKGKAQLQDITIAKRIGNRVQIGEGLNQGDVIVTNGFINLFDGANVTIK